MDVNVATATNVNVEMSASAKNAAPEVVQNAQRVALTVTDRVA